MYLFFCKYCIICRVGNVHTLGIQGVATQALPKGPTIMKSGSVEDADKGRQSTEERGKLPAKLPYLHPSQHGAPPSWTWDHPRSQQEHITLFWLELSVSTIIRPHIDRISEQSLGL